jgi:hypothetical protein
MVQVINVSMVYSLPPSFTLLNPDDIALLSTISNISTFPKAGHISILDSFELFTSVLC